MISSRFISVYYAQSLFQSRSSRVWQVLSSSYAVLCLNNFIINHRDTFKTNGICKLKHIIFPAIYFVVLIFHTFWWRHLHDWLHFYAAWKTYYHETVHFSIFIKLHNQYVLIYLKKYFKIRFWTSSKFHFLSKAKCV